jgi:hypothetical protein
MFQMLGEGRILNWVVLRHHRLPQGCSPEYERHSDKTWTDTAKCRRYV